MTGFNNYVTVDHGASICDSSHHKFMSCLICLYILTYAFSLIKNIKSQQAFVFNNTKNTVINYKINVYCRILMRKQLTGFLRSLSMGLNVRLLFHLLN